MPDGIGGKVCFLQRDPVVPEHRPYGFPVAPGDAALLLLRGDIAENGEIGVAAELRVQTVCTLHDDNGGCGDLRRGAVVHHMAIEAAVAKGPPLPQKRQNLLCKAFRMDIPAGGGKTLRRS